MVWFLSLSEGKKCRIPQPIIDLGYFASATFGLLRWNTGSVSWGWTAAGGGYEGASRPCVTALTLAQIRTVGSKRRDSVTNSNDLSIISVPANTRERVNRLGVWTS